MNARSRSILVLALLTFFRSVPVRAEKALSAEELFKKVSPSVFAVEIYDGSEPISNGSAVAAAPFVIPGKDSQFASFDRIAYPELFIRANQATDVVVTNFHLIEGHVWRRESKFFICRGTKRIPAQVVEVDANHDLMWLKGAGLNAPRVRLRDSSTLAVGEGVFAVGSPMGLENTISEGIVSGVRHEGTSRMIQTSAAISPGSSGGGLFDRFGALVGITEYTLRDSQNLNFAIPAETVTYFDNTQQVFLQRGADLGKAQAPHAIEQCWKAVKVSSDEYQYALAQLCFSNYYVQTGNLRRAEQLAKDALKTYQGFPDAHFILGQVYERTGKGNEASFEYQAASRMVPTNPTYIEAMIRMKKQIHRSQGARTGRQ